MIDEKFVKQGYAVMEEVKKVVIGKDDCVVKIMGAILAGGHILLDDIPGVGKTTMARAFSKAMDLASKRVQLTPDVLPSDITGFSMYDKASGEFVYEPGAVMCNLFLADELNRTSPKTQSALLEVMEENAVTVDGVTRPLPQPFVVMATENPVGSIGTQLLPESQLDRFMICISMGYPSLEDEIAIAKGNCGAAVDTIESVIHGNDLLTLQRYVSDIYVKEDVYEYMVRLVQATRKHDMVELGVSPRGTIALVNMAKAMAFLQKRDYVIPQDVSLIFKDVAAHRLVLNAKARVGHVPAENVLDEIMQSVKKPSLH